VLPNAFGFGFRWPTDHIWGIWQTDALTPNITKSVGQLLAQYNEKLDIVYGDGLQPGNNGYSQLIYWNAYDPTPSPSPSPTPSLTPTLSPTPNNTQPATFPTTMVLSVSVASIPIVGVFVILRFKKHN
jgi:hypothetical protein